MGASARLTLTQRLGGLLASRRARWLVPIAGVLLTMPSVATGLAFEDGLLRLHARGELGASLPSRLDLFSFLPSNPAARAHRTEQGMFPWFASPDVRVEFLRPLSAAWHVFDFEILDRFPWLMHLESVGLYAAVIALAAAIHRRLLPGPVAMLAALLLGLDYGHGVPVGWLSNRNALVATVLGFAALLAHDRWRRDAWGAGAWLGPFAFTLALLGGESGVGTLAYLVAHAAALDRAPRTRRALALLPYVLILGTWQSAYRRLGYGAHGTSFYLDPASAPAAFLSALPGRAVALLVGQLALPPAGIYCLLPTVAKVGLVTVGLLFLAYLARAMGPLLRASAEVRFLSLGMVLSLAPVVAPYPDNRLLLFVGLGASGIVAALLGDLQEPAPPDVSRGLRGFLIARHLMLAPLLLPGFAVAVAVIGYVVAPPATDASLSNETVVVVNAPTVLYAELLWLYPIDPARVAPRRVRVLAGVLGRVDVTREDAQTLLVSLAKGATPDPLMSLFRDDVHPMEAGDVFSVPGMRAEVARVDVDHAPVSVRFRFDRDLGDPSLRWIAWTGAFADVTPPGVGTTVTLGGKGRAPGSPERHHLTVQGRGASRAGVSFTAVTSPDRSTSCAAARIVRA